MLRMSVLVLLSVAACVSSPASPAPDAAPAPVDAAPIHTTCASSGDGTAGAACCVWDPSGPCGGGQTGLSCGWSGGATQNDGACQADSASPSRFYEPCTPGENSCYPGGVCMPAPGATIPTCRVLCRPDLARVYCGVDHACVPVTADGEVGICVSSGGL